MPTKPFEQYHYLAESLDPVHIGTGEFQLGRVDNTIVREPATRLPKIPGSSIAGVTRAYCAMHAEKYPGCAGKGTDNGEGHCGEPDCPVCTAFGFSKKSQGSFQGLAQFSDARLVLFPVTTAVGPVWITSSAALAGAGFESCGVSENELGDGFVSLGSDLPLQLNFGWLYLGQVNANTPVKAVVLKGPGGVALGGIRHVAAALDRVALVSDRLFAAIVNDQLEVRTSVSISPETGAAEDGALFTSEALPRACFLAFQITYWNPENFRIPKEQKIAFRVADLQASVLKGLETIEFAGIGGVNTRGMGRMRVVGLGGGR